MRMLLVSTYELGHQPLHLAAPAAALRAAGHDVHCVDTSVQAWDPQAAGRVDAVAFSVPMHTAMRLALPLARQVKAAHPSLPVAFYGLYAPLGREPSLRALADGVFTGDYLPGLLAWARAPQCSTVQRDLPARGPLPARPLPARDLLPPLHRYARLAVGDERRLVGCVEATQGCLHRCRHCPVPPFGGRFRAAPRPAVLDDVQQLVAMGARHITFGDPDFLNGPTHSLKLVREMHARWPWLTFDCTTKVDHVLDNARVWETFADCGCLFVVSAFETVNDDILQRLDKGHTTAQAAAAVRLLRAHGIEIRPSWLPFTPWTTLDDALALFEFVADNDLVGNVDPVQYTIRLLLPAGSLLLEDPDLRDRLGAYDPERLTWTWTARDARVDHLQRQLAALVEDRVTAGYSTEAIVREAYEVAAAAAPARARAGAGGSGPLRGPMIAAGSVEGRPRLTEPWFC